MKEIIVNTTLSSNKVVTENDSAMKVGSGLVDVFATPALIALCEKTASELLAPFLDEGEVSVGANVNIDHLAASKIGAKVQCLATITKVDGKKVFFDLSVTEDEKVVAKGTHLRCVVNKAKFLSRLG